MLGGKQGAKTLLLQLKNIGKIYDSNDILTIGIRGINLEFDYNEFVTIEGESGSGKSTLLNVIGANDSYEEGELYINGEETSHYGAAEWEKYREKYIATVFQDFNIIENLTVLENVELALLRYEDPKLRREKARELIERVGLGKQINQRGSKLSGGEKQRTVIARALAKDAPIILADEPTGNLDVKSSREIAKLLKEVSKDKLVIVVTHNPEFFVEYATRRVTIFDGAVKEDKVVQAPPTAEHIEIPEVKQSRRKNIKDTLHIGVLNYKSRPKFTAMMSFALLVCAVTLFVVLSVFGDMLIKPVSDTLDGVAVSGKLIVSFEDGSLTADVLDQAAGSTNAGFYLWDKDFAEFTVFVPKKSGMLSAYSVTCLYAPYQYNLRGGEAVLVLPESVKNDADAIAGTFVDANVGIQNVTVQTTLASDEVLLYISHADATDNGVKIKSVNTTMKLGETSVTVYSFEADSAVASGTVNLVNSNTYQATKFSAVFSVKSNKSYEVASDSQQDEARSGRLIVKMNPDDYAEIFDGMQSTVSQSVLYFADDQTAQAALTKLPDGMTGILSTSKVYVQNAGDIYAMNVVYYIALIAICLLFAALISVIFGRSVKVFQTDFAVYRTLGISTKISACSLYIQMALIFLPTIVLLPFVSLVAALIPGGGIGFITLGNYLFIELMLLVIVECVAFGFNRAINGQSIRKSLRRGSKG